jgi:hypothetical protein
MYPDDDGVRHPRGERHHKAKITNADARRILSCWQARRDEWGIQTALARQFHVSPGTVHSIIHGKTWRVATRGHAPHAAGDVC